MIDSLAREVAGVCARGPLAEKHAQTQPARSGFFQGLHLAQADDSRKLRAFADHGFRRGGAGLHGAGDNVCRDLAQIDILVSSYLGINGHWSLVTHNTHKLTTDDTDQD